MIVKSGYLSILRVKKSDEPKFLILSPGIPEHYPKPHKVASLAIEHKCKIICDIDLLAQYNNEATFIGVTGTNGKSTTTSLIGHIQTGSSTISPC